jgi:hypothetical protein
MAERDGGGKRGRCWGCGYMLEAIPSRRCPECGRAFDPDAPKTMNMTGSESRVVRWFIRHPLGYGMVGLVAVATVLVALTTRWPVGGLDWTAADVRYLMAPARLVEFWRHVERQVWTSILLVGGLELWALLLVVMLGRTAGRFFLMRKYGPGMVRGSGRRRGVFAGLMVTTVLLALVGADYRLAQE